MWALISSIKIDSNESKANDTDVEIKMIGRKIIRLIVDTLTKSNNSASDR